jgi:hypothetical protein
MLANPQLDGVWVAGLLYVLLSNGLEYIPAFSAWWDDIEAKRLVVAGAGLVVVIGLVALHYAGAFGLGIGPFGWAVVGEALETWIVFLGGNWAVWSLLEPSMPRKLYVE